MSREQEDRDGLGARFRAGAGGRAGFEQGMGLLFEGADFLRRHATLWPLALVPVLLALVFVAIAASLFLGRLGEITTWSNAWIPGLAPRGAASWLWVGPATFLLWIARGLVVVVLFGAAIVVALLCANLASTPFLERLSERVETILDEEEGLVAVPAPGRIRSTLRSFAFELQRLVLLACVWGGLVVVGRWRPGAELVTAPLLLGATLLFLPLDYTGHAFDRRGTSLIARLRFARAHFATMAGFGSVAFVAGFVPGFNLIVMPALVVAGTLLVVREQRATMNDSVGDLASFSESES